MCGCMTFVMVPQLWVVGYASVCLLCKYRSYRQLCIYTLKAYQLCVCGCLDSTAHHRVTLYVFKFVCVAPDVYTV